MKLHFRHILVTFALLQGTLAWAEPSLEQVYEATRSGRLEEAQQMMQEVLRAHPNSAKAHFTEAEVLARSGNLAGGRDELALAQKLQPGLPFAKPKAVIELQNELDHGTGSVIVPAGETGHTPWGKLWLVGGIALLLVIWLVRRQTAQGPMGMGMSPRPGGSYYNNGMGGGVPPSMGPTGGMGGGLMGSLATGAALGAGMVAGEALAHRLVDGPSEGVGSAAPNVSDAQGNSDMGGRDFGINDGGSWDSGADSGWTSNDSGSDWS
ncbi:MAG: hypothetical protein GJU77_04990 [Ferrovum sp.]|jgi:hypothetical protein|nr:hypothetical protein [Ferrovum sp.]